MSGNKVDTLGITSTIHDIVKFVIDESMETNPTIDEEKLSKTLLLDTGWIYNLPSEIENRFRFAGLLVFKNYSFADAVREHEIPEEKWKECMDTVTDYYKDNLKVVQNFNHLLAVVNGEADPVEGFNNVVEKYRLKPFILEQREKLLGKKGEENTTMEMFLQLQMDRPIDKEKHYISPGGFEVIAGGKNYQFDFLTSCGVIDEKRNDVIGFNLTNPDYESFPDMKELESHINEITDLVECFVYTGEHGDAEINPIKILDITITVSGTGKRIYFPEAVNTKYLVHAVYASDKDWMIDFIFRKILRDQYKWEMGGK